MSDVDYYRLKHKAEEFRDQLSSRLKKYSPNHYAVLVSNLIHEVLDSEDRRLSGKYPLHFLLHSIYTNCLFHHEHRDEELTEKNFNKIMNQYINYFDPVAMQLLESDTGAVPFFINVARQQFYTQGSYGLDSIARYITIFCDGDFKYSEEYFINKYGITFREWIIICFGTFASLKNKSPKTVTPQYFTRSDAKFVEDNSVINFFNENSVTPNEIKGYHSRIESKIGSIQTLFHETYIRSVFTEKPFLLLDNEKYLVIHKEFLIKRGIEGVFDICKKDIPSEFGREFGRNFERYIEKLLNQFIPKKKIFTEGQLSKYTSEKICDFMVVFDDFIILLECKGIEYSSLISSENAIKGDNSTRKISTGVEQLSSIAKLINEGVYSELIGSSYKKKIISAVITFKQLYQPNTDWYYDNIIGPNIAKAEVNLDFFKYRPQVLSISELEAVLIHCQKSDKTIYDVFSEKVPKSDFLSGDWNTFLNIQGVKVPFLEDRFNKFFKEELFL